MSRHFIAVLRWVLMGISLSAVAAAMVTAFIPNGICPALLLGYTGAKLFGSTLESFT